ncbi:MAG TPA: hypothetical protein VER11_29785 [Polyangiaceae bacterium]|nr:hypothetical protein [Polyangiaceae bacterium]
MRCERATEAEPQAGSQAGHGGHSTAKRASIDPRHDATRVTVMRVDLALALNEIRAAFDDVLTAELSDDASQHDALVLRALRHLRNAQSSVECEMGGAS